MHYPVEIVLGRAHIPAHLVFEILAYSLGFRAYQWARKRVQDPISTENRWWIFLGAVAGAFFGAHLLGILERPLPQTGNLAFYFMANKTVLGGFLGGLIGVEWTKKRIGVTHSSGDLMAYPMILALVIGRIGCHLAGLNDGTHGLPSSLPWAVDFGDGIPRHPVNLYEIGVLCLLALFIFVLENGYLCWRFAAEWLKPVWYFSFGLTSIQMAAGAGMLYYTWLYFWKKETIFS